jgi:hypothetical protein
MRNDRGLHVTRFAVLAAAAVSVSAIAMLTRKQ